MWKLYVGGPCAPELGLVRNECLRSAIGTETEFYSSQDTVLENIFVQRVGIHEFSLIYSPSHQWHDAVHQNKMQLAKRVCGSKTLTPCKGLRSFAVYKAICHLACSLSMGGIMITFFVMFPSRSAWVSHSSRNSLSLMFSSGKTVMRSLELLKCSQNGAVAHSYYFCNFIFPGK